MKTTNAILTDFYTVVKASPIDALNGSIYKRIRKNDSILEDCVISLITGNNAKFLQDAAIYIKIFYLDSQQDNTFYEDSKRGGELEELLFNLSTTLFKMNDYSFDLNSRETYTAKVDEINQHYAILKMNFKITI